jgi:hypothetical protein
MFRNSELKGGVLVLTGEIEKREKRAVLALAITGPPNLVDESQLKLAA